MLFQFLLKASISIKMDIPTPRAGTVPKRNNARNRKQVDSGRFMQLIRPLSYIIFFLSVSRSLELINWALKKYARPILSNCDLILSRKD